MSIQEQISICISYGGKVFNLKALPLDSPLKELGLLIQDKTNIVFETQKLIGKGLKSLLDIKKKQNERIYESGLKEGVCYMLIGSESKELNVIQNSKDAPGIIGFEDELKREKRRINYKSSTSIQQPHNGSYTFKNFKVLEETNLNPSSEKALEILYKLASDNGIQNIMKKYKWEVGLLSEMKPEGKVGVTSVCLLGYNKNKGEEISLRLRTDDMKGFRKYLTIRNVLIHELTHMVYSDHDDNFKQLNSALLKECELYEFKESQNHYLSGTTDSYTPEIEDFNGDNQIKDYLLGGKNIEKSDIKEAAALAAIQRQNQANIENIEFKNEKLNINTENQNSKFGIKKEIKDLNEIEQKKIKRIKDLKENLKTSIKSEDYEDSMKTLKRIIQNVYEYPEDDKYKVIKMKNKKFYADVGRHNFALNILLVLGFVEEKEEEPVLRYQVSNQKLLSECLNILSSKEIC